MITKQQQNHALRTIRRHMEQEKRDPMKNPVGAIGHVPVQAVVAMLLEMSLAAETVIEALESDRDSRVDTAISTMRYFVLEKEKPQETFWDLVRNLRDEGVSDNTFFAEVLKFLNSR